EGCAQLQRDGTGTDALFASPQGITVDPYGQLYVADVGNNAIRHVTLKGTVTTFAGNGVAGNVDGAGMNAEFNTPVAIVAAGSLFVLDTNNSGSTGNSGSMRKVTLTGSMPPPLNTPVSLYDTRTPGAQPYSIDWRSNTSPAAGDLWYTEGIGKIGRLTTEGISTEFSVGTGTPNDVVLGGDGTPWILDLPLGEVVHRNSAGQMLAYKLDLLSCCGTPTQADQMAYSPNGNIWFFVSSSQLGEVTPAGTISYVNVPSSYYNPSTLTVGTDGTIWLSNGNSIMHLSQTGAVLGNYNYAVQYLTTGADGNILFTQSDAVGSLNVGTGVITVYPIYESVPGCQSGYNCSRGISNMTVGPDGAYWFVEERTGYIGRLDTAGNFSEYQIYDAHVHPFDIVPGPDGNIWFVDSGAQKIGKVNLSAL
ncbi:MAG TPA: hypothetical protein VKT72_16350, partial [Candidatus Baltobacteraceae bacterium]|nr:hypothetical protein [Candidatus Baltobacteraceae bacterium]